MTVAERIRLTDADGWHWADEMTRRLADDGITGNVTPAIRAWLKTIVDRRCPQWEFNLITLAEGAIVAAPAAYKGTIE